MKYLNDNMFADSQAPGNSEIMDEPNVAAVSAAAESLFTEVFGRWAARPRFHIVFDIMEQNPAMENEVLYLFARTNGISQKAIGYPLQNMPPHIP